MKFYKVVKVQDGKYFSTNAEKELKTEYKVDRWVSAPVGGLLVFNSLNAAAVFNDKQKNPIFLCEVMQPVKMPKMTATWDLPFMLRLWENLRVARTGKSGWPTGAKAFRLVKLVEEIKPEANNEGV